jgi:tetratricopeptide (TPR) repeat protein
VGIDRESAVKKAEELVREGKIDLAIQEYARLVDDQPGDHGAANALGDLYAKVGNRALAAGQFVRIGDHHRESGFMPKAVAFYKKALKADPASDHALSQLAQIAVNQELYADATLYVNRLLQIRREQKNDAGVADCLVRLGGFPSASPDAKMAAARASAAYLSADQTARFWVDAADALDRAGRPREAVDVLIQAASLDPANIELRRRVALACVTSGELDRARDVLSLETAGDHPDLLLALADHAAADGRADDVRSALERLISVAPDRRAEAESRLPSLAPPPPAMPPEVLAEDAATPADTSEELEFSALLDDLGGEVTESADDAVYIEPEPIRELELEPDLPSDAESETETETETDTETDTATEPEATFDAAPETGLAPEPELAPPAATAPAIPDASAADVESIASLTAAAQNPSLQFLASAQLGRLLLRLGRVRDGIGWLERATQAATAVREQRLDVMYELADALEREGDLARALDVFGDLEFDAASFRDVPARITSLRRALGGGPLT